MTRFLIRRFVQHAEDTGAPSVRKQYGILSGVVGVAVNCALFALKCAVGLLTGSIAIVADAFNNLSDAGAAIVTIIGFRIAARPNDAGHPFGHGRAELIAALAVSFMILLMGVEFFRQSISRMIRPEAVLLNAWGALLLLCAVGAKLWLFAFNRALSRAIGSAALRATAMDSLSDVAVTSVVLLTTLAARWLGLALDGYAGIVVACVIVWGGVRVAREAVDSLLGEGVDPHLAARIRAMVLQYDGILGVHDLIVHDYGAGRCIASIHAEVPSDVDIMTSHAAVDRAEREVAAKLGIQLCIHMDPLVVNDARLNAAREQIAGLLRLVDERLTMHDLRMIDVGDHINLVFDIVVPTDMDAKQAKVLMRAVQAHVAALDARYRCIITAEHSFVRDG